MKLLAISDIHSELEKIAELRQKAKKIDVVCVSGDITNFGPKRIAEKAVELLEEFNARVLAVPGNLDTSEVIEALNEKGCSLHKKKELINGYCFIGLGGSTTKPAGEGMLATEEDVFENLDYLFKEEKYKNKILLTHQPPKNTKIDLSHSGQHIGSESVKTIIQKYQPLLHLCGHVHEAFGEARLGKTLSVNIGALNEGNALLVDLGKEIKLKRIKV